MIVFAVDRRRHALPLSTVEKVELAVEVTPFPEAPRVVLGALAWRGRVLPVLSLRRRWHLPERPVRTSDMLIVAKTSRRLLALLVDEVLGVEALREVVGSQALSVGLGTVAGATRMPDEIVLIHDLDLFLTEEEEKALGTP